MRRFGYVAYAALAAACFVCVATLSTDAQTSDQYVPADGTTVLQPPPEKEPPDREPPDREPPDRQPPDGQPPDRGPSALGSVAGEAFVSQGSVVEPDSRAARAAQRDLAVEEKLPRYSQTVDNASKKRFRAPGWKVRRDGKSHGKNYASSSSRAKPARFKVKIPTTNDYSVYAWWPRAAGNSTASRFSVQTAAGTKKDKVNQRTEGGAWIKIGAYAMKKGERYVGVTPTARRGDGRSVADAVMVVRGEMALPPEKTAPSSPARRGSAAPLPSGPRYGDRIVAEAGKHLKDAYSYGTCTASLKSCTCLTKVAVAPSGHELSMDEEAQWRYGRSVKVSRSNIRPGDEIFFKEDGPDGPITHVGIYSGNGHLLHASGWFGEVVNSEMRYIQGYAGAKRFTR